MNTVTAIRKELIDLLENSKPVKGFFTNPGLPALIMREEDMKGLDQIADSFFLSGQSDPLACPVQ
jgi:hypothetical protein